MKKFFYVCVILCFSLLLQKVKANDGVYYAQGNQLIPITETDIRVQKEVLTIQQLGNEYLVTVYYEFFNPGKDKDILVGFEANPPYPQSLNSIDDAMSYTEHPYIHDFSVRVNQENLLFDVARVCDSNYYDHNQWMEISRQRLLEIDGEIPVDDWMNLPYRFVYHFNAHFKEGVNIVQHQYRYRGNVNIAGNGFNYVLTAANRWANHQIDDFTLILELDSMSTYYLNQYEESFFSPINQWQIQGGQGQLKIMSETYPSGLGHEWLAIHLRSGKVVFQAKNFHPTAELSLIKPIPFEIEHISKELNTIGYNAFLLWNGDTAYLSDHLKQCKKNATRKERQIWAYLPYAYRGLVFKDKYLKKQFEATDWYMAIPNAKEILSEKELNWMEFWRN